LAGNWVNLAACVKKAKEAGLKIVISIRTGPGRNEADITKPFTGDVRRTLLDDPESESANQFCAMWQRLAREYGRDPDVVGFDLLVEPHAPDRWVKDRHFDAKYRSSQNWPRLARKAIEKVRAETNVMPILVEPDLWGAARWLNSEDDPGPDGPQAWKMPSGERLVCAAHQYHPSGYAEDGKEQFDPKHVELRTAFEAIRKWRNQTPDIPLCVNEFGVKRWLPGAPLFLHEELRLLKKEGLNHAVWSWDATHPLWDARDFDVRSNLELLGQLMANWQENANALGDQRRGPAGKDPRTEPSGWGEVARGKR
jgi:hypothetical protein